MTTVSTPASGHLDKEMARIQESRENLNATIFRKKEELKYCTLKPVDLDPWAIPGNPVAKFMCDNCHHKGHRANGNKGNKCCPFVACPGYHHCGQLSKHREFRQQITEVKTLFLNTKINDH